VSQGSVKYSGCSPCARAARTLPPSPPSDRATGGRFKVMNMNTHWLPDRPPRLRTRFAAENSPPLCWEPAHDQLTAAGPLTTPPLWLAYPPAAILRAVLYISILVPISSNPPRPVVTRASRAIKLASAADATQPSGPRIVGPATPGQGRFFRHCQSQVPRRRRPVMLLLAVLDDGASQPVGAEVKSPEP
jgi:hypothetical protein